MSRSAPQPSHLLACVVEIEVDGVKEDNVVKRGLRRVEKVDGGLTRKRWEAKNSEKNLKVSCKFRLCDSF
ncbi:hypothetical protein FOC1_g10013480 [Fusarium oxysporum f. sp. cubense race 1]|uniref:Uncharacterized protein n=1 Tax=Fusarium oxysporum f. sp. cubense (strain race 1) TaxID=1229664 RepID=N4TNA6_FUSC1|nr:hypothetical protein FOC1_g10013480 [Fusarium oxysporum f. sp. cubense race 1]